MDRQRVRLIQEWVVETLKQAGMETKFGVKLQPNGSRYGSTYANIKLEVSEVGKDGVVQTRDAESWKMCAKFMGLPEDGLGKTFEFKGNIYRVSGLNPKARVKYNVSADRVSDGKTFRFQADMVAKKLKEGSNEPPRILQDGLGVTITPL